MTDGTAVDKLDALIWANMTEYKSGRFLDTEKVLASIRVNIMDYVRPKKLKFSQDYVDEPDASAKSIFGVYRIGCNLEEGMQWYVTGPMGFNAKVDGHEDAVVAAQQHFNQQLEEMLV